MPAEQTLEEYLETQKKHFTDGFMTTHVVLYWDAGKAANHLCS